VCKRIDHEAFAFSLVGLIALACACSSFGQEKRYEVRVYQDVTFPTIAENPNFENPFINGPGDADNDDFQVYLPSTSAMCPRRTRFCSSWGSCT
jgi:hypothetical protein